MLTRHQIKGIIALGIILAVIPFIRFYISLPKQDEYPVMSTAFPGALVTEIVDTKGVSGIYFVKPGTSLNQVLAVIGIDNPGTKDFEVKNGMKIRLVSGEEQTEIVPDKIDAAKRLALGLPVDINRIGVDELCLIPGIGPKRAAGIVAWREKNGSYKDLEQLMNIQGIKERKLSKLKQYLYVEK